ncbi:hypothetical protein V1525DRAFT_450771 [Lipomyces kononenkoae]|uniref:Uncharacterized protein n=1 Tax=Lipomyces kononenkoae TaxID=34357 RepID=A0ACC3T188_LIPKO
MRPALTCKLMREWSRSALRAPPTGAPMRQCPRRGIAGACMPHRNEALSAVRAHKPVDSRCEVVLRLRIRTMSSAAPSASDEPANNGCDPPVQNDVRKETVHVRDGKHRGPETEMYGSVEDRWSIISEKLTSYDVEPISQPDPLPDSRHLPEAEDTSADDDPQPGTEEDQPHSASTQSDPVVFDSKTRDWYNLLDDRRHTRQPLDPHRPRKKPILEHEQSVEIISTNVSHSIESLLDGSSNTKNLDPTTEARPMGVTAGDAYVIQEADKGRELSLTQDQYREYVRYKRYVKRYGPIPFQVFLRKTVHYNDPKNVSVRNIRILEDYSALRDDEGVFMPANVFPRRKKIIQNPEFDRWEVQEEFKTANLPREFFLMHLDKELNDMKVELPARIVARILPVLQRASENPTPYNLILDLYRRKSTDKLNKVLRLLCIAFSIDKDVRLTVLDSFGSLLFKLPAAKFASLLCRIYGSAELRNVCRLLSPPGHRHERNQILWLGSQIKVASEVNPEGARMMLSLVIIHLALEYGYDFLAGSLAIKILRSSPPDQRANLVPLNLLHIIVGRLLDSVEYNSSLVDLGMVVDLWKELIALGGTIGPDRQFKIMELTLQFTDDTPASPKFIHDPDSVMALILKQQTAIERVPISFYISTINRHLRIGNTLGALRHYRLMERHVSGGVHPPPDLTAKILHALSKARLYKEAHEFIVRLSVAAMKSSVIVEAIVNFAARTDNASLASQMLRHLKRPYSRSMLRQLLFFSTKHGDQRSRDSMIRMINDIDEISPEEFGMLVNEMYENHGLQEALNLLNKSPPHFTKEGWMTVLHKAFLEHDFDTASAALSHVMPDDDGYYLGTLLTYVSREMGASKARNVLQSLLDRTLDVENLSGRRQTREQVVSAELRRLARALDRSSDNDLVFTRPRQSSIDADLFLYKHRFPGRRIKREKQRNSTLVDGPLQKFDVADVTSGAETGSLLRVSAVAFDMSIFDGTKPTALSVHIVGRLALHEGDIKTFNWALITLEFMGISAVDIRSCFITDVNEYRAGNVRFEGERYSRGKRRPRHRFDLYHIVRRYAKALRERRATGSATVAVGRGQVSREKVFPAISGISPWFRREWLHRPLNLSRPVDHSQVDSLHLTYRQRQSILYLRNEMRRRNRESKERLQQAWLDISHTDDAELRVRKIKALLTQYRQTRRVKEYMQVLERSKDSPELSAVEQMRRFVLSRRELLRAQRWRKRHPGITNPAKNRL